MTQRTIGKTSSFLGVNLEQELKFVRKLGSGLFCEQNWRVDQKEIYFFHTAVFKSEKLMFGKFFSKLAFVQFFEAGSFGIDCFSFTNF